jgi:signal peptidase I
MSARTARPGIVVIAIIAASLTTVVFLLSALWKNPVIAIPQAILAGVAAVGLTRGDPWSGYGLALFLTCSTVGGAIAGLRAGGVPDASFLIAAVVPLSIAALTYLGGRAITPGRGIPLWATAAWGAVSAVPLALSFFLNLVVIPTASMEPTLLPGDTLIVLRTKAASLTRGDIVVYRDPDNQTIFAKRIAGMGGDRIHLDHRRLYRNGRRVDEPYVQHTTNKVERYRDNFPVGDLNVPLSATMSSSFHNRYTMVNSSCQRGLSSCLATIVRARWTAGTQALFRKRR